MKTKFLIENKEFLTTKGLLKHVEKMFPNADIVEDFEHDEIILFLRDENVAKLNIKNVGMSCGVNIKLVDSNMSLI